MEGSVFWAYVKCQAYWIIPSVTSFAFALTTTILIVCQSKWQKLEKSRNSTFIEKQSRLQETQVCIDLMQNRLSYYNAYLTLISSVALAGKAIVSDLRIFRASTISGPFLFGQEVISYQKKFESTVDKLIIISKKIESINKVDRECDEFVALSDDQYNLTSEITQSGTDLNILMRPYLDFSKISQGK